MKINPWIVVSLMALVCGFLLGSRVENEAEAEAPMYQYFYDPDGQRPSLGNYLLDKPMYCRVNLKTGQYQGLKLLAVTDKDGNINIKDSKIYWEDSWSKSLYQK